MILTTPEPTSNKQVKNQPQIEHFCKCLAIERALFYFKHIVPEQELSQEEKQVLNENIKEYETRRDQLNCANYDFTSLYEYLKACRTQNEKQQKHNAFIQNYCDAAGISLQEFKKTKIRIYRACITDIEKL